MASRCDILLAGSMDAAPLPGPDGSIRSLSDIIRDSLESHGLTVRQMPFPQNIHHDEFGYHRLLVRTLAELRPRLIFPVGDALSLAHFREVLHSGRSFRIKSDGGKRVSFELPEDIILACEDAEKILLLSGKVSFSTLVRELGIRQPRSYDSPAQTGLPSEKAADKPGRLSSISDSTGTENRPDIIFKRNVSYGGHGVHRPRTLEALENLISHQSPGEPYLIQDFIPGTDFSVDAIRFSDPESGSAFFKASTYKVLSSNGNGPSADRQVLPRPDLEAIAGRIMDALDCQGLCGFDFRVTAQDEPYLLECNPRFTGGLPSQLESGFDIPYILYKHYIQICNSRKKM